MYLNFPDSVINWFNIDKFNNFSQISYEFLFSENAVCHKFDYFDFIASSSEFDGYTSIQTYYVISKSNKLTDIKCSVFNGECSCIPLKSKRDREVLKNSKKEFQSFYTVKKFKNLQFLIIVSYNSKLTKCPNTNISLYHNKIKEFINKPFPNSISKYFKQGSFKQLSLLISNYKYLYVLDCIRICKLAQWKRNLIKTNSSNHIRFDNELPCTNNLSVNSYVDQFGIAILKDNSNHSFETKYKLLINIYDDFLNELLLNCMHLEIMLKYSVRYRKIGNLTIENMTEFEQVVYLFSILSKYYII